MNATEKKKKIETLRRHLSLIKAGKYDDVASDRVSIACTDVGKKISSLNPKARDKHRILAKKVILELQATAPLLPRHNRKGQGESSRLYGAFYSAERTITEIKKMVAAGDATFPDFGTDCFLQKLLKAATVYECKGHIENIRNKKYSRYVAFQALARIIMHTEGNDDRDLAPDWVEELGIWPLALTSLCLTISN